MAIKLAVAGFRHAHIFSLLEGAGQLPGFEIVAACEEDPAVRAQLRAGGKVNITHDHLGRMLDEVPCDALATGEWFGGRGRVLVEALARGKHVISDKPVCTSLDELAEIRRLAENGNLKVGCMFSLRDSAVFREVRRIIREGVLGEIQAIAFGGQHPMLRESRPAWYFEPGRHGGTLNDIGVHAADLVPWLTGLDYARVAAARTWNAFVPGHPGFRDAAQFMAVLANGCGVLGDVSYFAPDSMGYRTPFYWRFTFFGRRGFLEAGTTLGRIVIGLDGEETPRELAVPAAGRKYGYLLDFRADIEGAPPDGERLDTAAVLRASRVALLLQRAADENGRDLPLA